jgi:quinol monooxygenase YgiN
MARFAQQTRLLAATGCTDALVARFLDACEIQRDNPACELMIVGKSTSEDDVVYVLEVWASQPQWEQARASDEIATWAQGMADLVAAPPETARFDAAGKGLSGPG